VVAFETAQQLFKLGISVKGVVLIDAPSPVDHVHLSEALVDFIANMDPCCANADIKRLVKTQLTMNSHMLERYQPNANCAPYPPLVQLRSREPFVADGVDDVPEWLADRTDPRKAYAGWEKIVGVPVRSWDIPGNHFQPFQASNVHSIYSEICRIL
jgi:thioesterase domain-containing protein